MTPPEFTAWRSGLDLSQEAAARSLGLSLRTVQRYEAGALPIPHPIDLACRYLELLAYLSKLVAPVSDNSVTKA